MDNQELRKHLEQIHNEIEQAQSTDEKGKALLRDLDADIRLLLERSEKGPVQAHPTMVRRLGDTIQHLEATHPALTKLLSGLLEKLSNTGI